MTFDTLQTLVEYLPEHLLWALRPHNRAHYEAAARDRQEGNDRGILYDPAIKRLLLSYSDMEFGWNLVRVLADNHLPFPGGLLVGDDEMLFRAYIYQTNPRRYGTSSIRGALNMVEPAMQGLRTTVQGLLLVEKATVQEVAKRVRMPRDVIAAYEKLFFNVLDRKEDMQYLQSIVYPHGRMVELMDDYLKTTPLSELARRAGYNNGAEDVLFFMGASNSAMEALLQAASAKQLESFIMAFGLLMARNGGLNQASLPALNNAKQLLTAGKIGGEVNQDRALSTDLSETLRREIGQYSRAAAALVDVPMQ